MSMAQVFQMAFRNLLASKLRFVQCMLALVVGVAGVVAVLALGFTTINFSDASFEIYTPGLLSCFISQNAAYPKAVDEAALEQLVQNNPEVFISVTPLIGPADSMYVTLRNGAKIYEQASLQGVSEDYLAQYTGVQVQAGRFLEPLDIRREQKVCVLGYDIAGVLFDGDALGENLRLFGENYQVVGVLAEEELVNFEALIPYTAARKMFGEDIRTYNGNSFYYDHYIVLANGSENMSEAGRLLEDMLRQKTGGETGSVYESGTRWTLSTYGGGMFSEMMRGVIGFYIYAGLGIAGVVLLISCVGIMNVMVASVQERTREIGIRRAFGATTQDIKRQFTLEAVATSLIGGWLGVALGLAAVVIMAAAGLVLPIGGGYQFSFADMNWLTLSLPILAALAACVAVGVISAAYPAQQAAKIEPVQAISEG